MTKSNLILVLGDQLDRHRGALATAIPGRDVVVMAEVQTEATYAPHNRHKIAFIFSAMRHFVAAKVPAPCGSLKALDWKLRSSVAKPVPV